MTFPIFTSVASFIIDDIRIHHSENAPPEEKLGLLGGAGSFCLFGTRIFLTKQNASALAFVAHEGRECSALESLKSLDITLSIIPHSDMDHPRAWNTFSTINPSDLNETRGFCFQTPELEYANHFRILPAHLPAQWLDSLEYIHVCTSGDRLQKWVQEFKSRSPNRSPTFVWEPSPNSCKQELYDDFRSALEFASVVSPNHEELASLLGLPTDRVDLDMLAAKAISLASDVGFVIRAGARGCIVIGKGSPEAVRIPAYWTSADAQRVVDVTGAGNSFMGGLMIGLKESEGDLVQAALYGSVSSSFTVEQFGPPVLQVVAGQELWNGERPKDRVLKLQRRIFGITASE
ncbi:Ribokinase-like protein [Obelidium mucronatum]|nr:Ribokinase-like protein [Obelidium mucronatum]